MLRMKERIICYAVASIMFFAGMCLESMETDSSFAYATSGNEKAVLSSVDYLTEGFASCTNEMIGKTNNLSVIRGGAGRTTIRWDKFILMSILVGVILQYLLYLRSAIVGECCEILRSDMVAVRYIHCKDGEK